MTAPTPQTSQANAVASAIASRKLKKRERRDPPAVLKMMTLIRAAIQEADALMNAHGHGCDCTNCWNADGFTWSLEMAYGCLDGMQLDFYGKEVTEVNMIREHLTKRFGDSNDPGNPDERLGVRWKVTDEAEQLEALADQALATPEPLPDKVVSAPAPVRFREWL